MFSPLFFHEELSRVQRLGEVFSAFDDGYVFGSEPFFPLLTPQLHLLQTFDAPCQEECVCANERVSAKAAPSAATSEQKPSGEQKQATAANSQPTQEATASASTNTPNTSGQQPLQQANLHFPSTSSSLRPWGGAQFLRSPAPLFVPRADVVENHDHYLVNFELPGISKEDVKVSLSADGLLSIAAEHVDKQEHRDENSKVHRLERRFGMFKRSIQLPDDVNAEAVKATQENGLLQISLPKKARQEPEQPKQIPIY